MIGRGSRHEARPGLPAVNVLSPWVFEQMATRRLRQRFVAAGLALVLLLVGAWAVQHVRVGQARLVESVEQAETARLTEEVRTLVPVRTFVTGVEQQKAAVQQTMQYEIYFSEVLDGLQAAAPASARFESVVVTPAPPAPGVATGAAPGGGTAPPPATEAPAGGAPPAPASPCPGPDPFDTRVVIGCVTLAGSAASRADVGELVVRLGDDPAFVEPFISTTTTADEERVSFSGSVGLSRKLFTKRFADIEALLARTVGR